MNYVEAEIVKKFIKQKKENLRPKRGQSAMVDVDLLVNSI